MGIGIVGLPAQSPERGSVFAARGCQAFAAFEHARVAVRAAGADDGRQIAFRDDEDRVADVTRAREFHEAV